MTIDTARYETAVWLHQEAIIDLQRAKDGVREEVAAVLHGYFAAPDDPPLTIRFTSYNKGKEILKASLVAGEQERKSGDSFLNEFVAHATVREWLLRFISVDNFDAEFAGLTCAVNLVPSTLGPPSEVPTTPQW